MASIDVPFHAPAVTVPLELTINWEPVVLPTVRSPPVVVVPIAKLPAVSIYIEDVAVKAIPSVA